MIQLREDKFLGRAVYIAEQRQQRPNDFRTSAPPAGQENEPCPFCAGNESQTPAAVFESCDDSDDKGAGNWQVRVVPNKYPFVGTDQASSAFGIHEVIIESPRHVSLTGDLSEGELTAVLLAYQQRLRHWSDADRLACPVLFKNVGRQAGASLVHLHSQLVVLPDVPAPMTAELDRLDQHHCQTGDCEFCRRFADELADGLPAEQAAPHRVVAQQGEFLAICPFASVHPYETWIAPIAHHACFEDLSDVADLAKLLLDTLRRVEHVIGEGGYNLILQTAPWQHKLSKRYHWRIEIRPQLSHLAGFELASGRFVNHVAPEHAAEKLRNAELATISSEG